MNLLRLIWAWLKAVLMLPRNLAKVAQINQNLEIQQELSEAKKRVKEAEDRLASDAAIKAGRMFFFENVIWAKDANGQIDQAPYCARCFELDGKSVHLIRTVVSSHGYPSRGKCPECKADEIPFRVP